MIVVRQCPIRTAWIDPPALHTGIAMISELLTVEAIPASRYVTVRAAGEIDPATAPILRDALLDAVRHDGATVLLDLAGVTFMDSTGIGVLLGTERRVTLEGGRLIICRPSGPVMRVLDVLGVTRFLNIVPSAPSPTLLTDRGPRLPA
jgi:anti-sigma B factor antagonist